MAQATSGNKKIAIVGAGHMGTALYEGLIRSGVRKSQVILSKRGTVKKSARVAGVIFLCVKPGAVGEVLKEIGEEIRGKAVISVAAGLSVAYLKKHAKGARIARIMPNMPVAIGEGVIGFMRGTLSTGEVKTVSKLLTGLGLVVEAKTDRELDALTLIAGCGPGVVASLVEALSKNAARYGITGFRSEQVAFQTFKGTLGYMQKNLTPAAVLKKAVATKGGVTEAILNDFEKKLHKNLAHALDIGRKRIAKIRR